jgi:hypothetical protein
MSENIFKHKDCNNSEFIADEKKYHVCYCLNLTTGILIPA